MATVLQEYRNIVHDHKPNAKLVRRAYEQGGFVYAIVADGEEIVSNEVSPSAAWREASAVLQSQ